MLRARVLAIAAGYEDVTDLDALRRDPAFLMALGREPETGLGLCSKPTMHRLENAPGKAASRAMVDWFYMSFPTPPGTLTLDIDETPDTVHGGSRLALFNGHYGMTCHLPIHIYDVETSRPVAVAASRQAAPGRELRAIMRVVVRRLRRTWPGTMGYLEAEGCGYLFGLPANRRIDALFAERADALKAGRVDAAGPDGTLRDQAEARYDIALPLPEGLRGGAAARVVGAMLAKGFVEEVDADMRKGEPVWRETDDGHGVTLVATDAGLAAIGIEPKEADLALAGAADGPTNTPVPDTPTGTGAAPKARTPREGTKQARLIAMLRAGRRGHRGDHGRNELAVAYGSRRNGWGAEEEAGTPGDLGKGRGPRAGLSSWKLTPPVDKASPEAGGATLVPLSQVLQVQSTKSPET